MRIGNRVGNNYESSDNYGEEGVIAGVRESDGKFFVEYDNGETGYVRESNLTIIGTSSVEVSDNKITKMGGLISRFADLFRAEPQKTYRKLGILDSNDNLTQDGKDMFLNKLFWANEEALVRPDAIKLLEAESKDK